MLAIEKSFRHDVTIRDGQLVCPRCDSEYLHHATVDVFNRAEDATEGQHVKVPSIGWTEAAEATEAPKPRSTIVDTTMDGNPSRRRDGLRIAFDCEHCGSGLSLCIAQHKGLTLLAWEVMPQ